MAGLTTARAAIVAALAEADAALGSVVTPTPPPPPAASSFKSVSRTATNTYPPLANPGQRAEFLLHGSGGGNYTWGDTYAAVGDASMGINDNMPVEFHTQNGGGYYSTLPNPTVQPYVLIQPVDHVAALAVHPMETNWAGYKHLPTPKVAHVYTHAILDALYAWVAGGGLPMVDLNRLVATGTSMGARGHLHWGLRRPQLWAAMMITLPGWRWLGLNDWETGLATTRIDTTPLPDGTPWNQYMDVVNFIANPANSMPPLFFGVGKTDSFSDFQETIDAIGALRATNRVFACAWNNGPHSSSTATETMGRIQASYKPESFLRGQGAPVLKNSSLDTPFTADVGGINLGYAWRNVQESAGAWSCELTNAAAATVTVQPHSTVYAGSVAPKTVTIPAGTWVPVTFP